MASRNALLPVAAVCLGAVFAVGLVHFARFAPETGYPPNSTLQPGPHGTKLLFDALEASGKVRVSRNYLPLSEVKFENSAVFYLGVSPDFLMTAPESSLVAFEGIALSGNRIIIGLAEGKSTPVPNKKSAIETRWGIRAGKEPGDWVIDTNLWREFPSGGWERSFGNGSIALLTQTERLDNAAIAAGSAARATAADFIGIKRQVVFEESHLGTVETGSIAALARRYRLEGLAIGILLVSILFVWSRSWAFPPPSLARRSHGPVVAGSDTRSMFNGLIARHIRPEQLVELCVTEWNRLRPAGRAAHSVAGQIRDTKSPIAAYRKIQEQLQCKTITKS